MQDNEKNDSLIMLPILPDSDAFNYFIKPLHLPVNLGGSDPDTTRIEYRIRAPVYYETAAARQRRILTERPYSGETLEIGSSCTARTGELYSVRAPEQFLRASRPQVLAKRPPDSTSQQILTHRNLSSHL